MMAGHDMCGLRSLGAFGVVAVGGALLAWAAANGHEGTAIVAALVMLIGAMSI